MTDEAPVRSITDRIADALANAVSEGDPHRLVLRSLVIYESLNENGERVMSVIPSPDCRTWDILGLAQWALGCAENMQHGELNAQRGDGR